MSTRFRFTTVLCLIAAMTVAATASHADDRERRRCLVAEGATGASHEMEEASAAIHDFLHDERPELPLSGSAAHHLEETSAALHDDLHDTEATYPVVVNAWRSLARQLFEDRALRGDRELRRVFQDTRRAFHRLRRQLSSKRGGHHCAIRDRAPGASHDFEEAAAAIHEFLHEERPGLPEAGSAAHHLEESAAELHDLLHDVAGGIPEIRAAWWNFASTLDDEAEIEDDDPLEDLFEEVAEAFEELDEKLGSND